MLIHNKDEQLDLLEVFCSPSSTMTQTANNSGLKAERWTIDDVDLSRPSGYYQAAYWLRELKPKRLWLSPECGPFSIMQNAILRNMQQVQYLIEKRKHGFRMWQSCIRLAKIQLELGGTFYIEQPQRCMSWTLEDPKTRHLIDDLSTYCIRDQCFDGLTHPKSGLPMQKSTRIQTNDTAFAQHFAQRCQGHEHGHTRIEGGNTTYETAFYPKRFCQRAVQLWKHDNNHTSKGFLRTYQASHCEEENHKCADCHSIIPTTHCLCCSPDMFEPESTHGEEAAMPAVHQLLKEIPDDDEGDAEKSSEQ